MADKDLQRDEENAATPEDAMRAQIKGELADVHTSMPGIVVSFDPAKQTAVVQPAIKRVWVEDGPLPLPQCVDVPVSFPRGGNFIFTFPIAKSDEVLLHFSKWAIDDWWDRGGVREPSEVRQFDLSDAFAAPGYSSRGRAVGGFSMDGCELRTLDGTTVLRIEGGAIYVGAKAGAEPTLKATTYRAAEDTYLDAIVTAVQAALTALTLPVPAAALKAAQTAFKGLAGGFVTQKAKVF